MISRRRVSGLTLIEIFSTVFIMGLGLIMVAAAFPVGIDQVRRSGEDTNSAMAARNALEYLHGENVFQNMSKKNWDDLIGSGTTWAQGVNTESNNYRIHNPWRRLYIDGGSMWPPEPGDLLWRAFLTRLSDADQVPLFRVTIVVVRYSKQSPELHPGYPPPLAESQAGPHHPFLARGPTASRGPCQNPQSCSCSQPRPHVVSRTVPIKSNAAGSREVYVESTLLARLVEGDYVMDPYSGFCYRVVKFAANGQSMDLDRAPSPSLRVGTALGVFSNVVGVYYTMLSG